jgi:hypothetical protein
MAGKAKTDTFANFAAVKVQESAAATQTSVKYAFPFSIMDKMALIISRIEYWLPSFVMINTSADIFYCAVTASAAVIDIANQADPLIIDSMATVRTDYGAAASGILTQTPFIKDFSALPGGGLITAPSPLYGMVQGVGTTPAALCFIKLFYTYIELATDEYWQLVESRRVISS